MVITPEGKGEVLSVNVLREQVRVAVKKKDKDEKELMVFACSDLKIVTRKKKCGGGCCGKNKEDGEFEGFDFSKLE